MDKIKAIEFHTGNLVLLDNSHVAEVLKIDAEKNTITVKNEYNRRIDGSTGDEFLLSSGFVSGIQLSYEWFDKFGYKKHDDKYYHSESYLNNLGPVAFVYKGQWCMNSLPLGANNFKYVHQFQNLIFALTSKALPITPPSTLP